METKAKCDEILHICNVFVQFLLHKCAFLLYIYPFPAFESMRKCHFFTFVGFYMQQINLLTISQICNLQTQIFQPSRYPWNYQLQFQDCCTHKKPLLRCLSHLLEF